MMIFKPQKAKTQRFCISEVHCTSPVRTTQPKMCSIHNDDDSQVDGNESSRMKKCRKLEIEDEKLKGDVNNLSRHCWSLKAIYKLLLKIKRSERTKSHFYFCCQLN